MSETILEKLVKDLRARHGALPDVAEITGVPISTLRKIAQGASKNPTLRHVQALTDYFVKFPATDEEIGRRQAREEQVAHRESTNVSTPAVDGPPMTAKASACSTRDDDWGSGDPRHGERREPEQRARIDRRKGTV